MKLLYCIVVYYGILCCVVVSIVVIPHSKEIICFQFICLTVLLKYNLTPSAMCCSHRHLHLLLKYRLMYIGKYAFNKWALSINAQVKLNPGMNLRTFGVIMHGSGTFWRDFRMQIAESQWVILKLNGVSGCYSIGAWIKSYFHITNMNIKTFQYHWWNS